MTEAILDRLSGAVVPVLRTSTLDSARTLVDWLAEGGITVFEITTTVPGHLDLLGELAADPRLICGMGTVLDAATADAAIAAGARFLVSPCTVPTVIDRGVAQGVPVLPGAATPTEVFTAHTLGAAAVKVFPASQLGGPGFLKAVRSVLPAVPLVPTGGIEMDEIDAYLAAGAFAVGMGSQLAAEADVKAGRRDLVLDRARRIASRGTVE